MKQCARREWRQRATAARPSARLRLLSLAALVVLAGCSGLRRAGPVADLRYDEEIRAEVGARLAHEPSIEAERIRVVVRGGVVSLYGAVQGFGALQCAIATAQLAGHVRTVVDQLELEPGPRQVVCLLPPRL
jgi:hypothetical protein